MNTAVETFINVGMEPYYRCEWIDIGELSLYLKKIHIVAENRLLNALVISNITTEPKYRGRGRFKRAYPKLKRLAKEAGFDCVAFEQVINPRLRKRLEKQGYKQYGCIYSKHYYKLLH